MTIAPDSLPKTAEPQKPQPPHDTDVSVTDDEKRALLEERILVLERQLGSYALPLALGSISRAQAYFERARTVGNAKDVLPNADTSRRLAEKELQNAALSVASTLGSHQEADQWVQAYFGANEALKAIAQDQQD